jgi:hypothetical protein
VHGVEFMMDELTEFYNLHESGTRDYFPVTLHLLPRIYATFLTIWVYSCCVRHHTTAEHVYAIMGALMFKTLQ